LVNHLAFPAPGVQVAHVAGTNGKGSVCAMIEAVARACGRRTGLFTSPHLVDFRERVRVAGEEIPEEAVAEGLTALRAICERMDPHPTFFEISLALAMRWFRDTGCELIILETGMGGRFDATTAVPADVCVVTPIGLDHTQYLGDTLEAIAAEKAGIFLPGVPALSAPQAAGAREVLERHANEVRAPLAFVEEPLRGYAINLPGPHQAWNAALAVAALSALRAPLTCDTVRHGLARVNWPGRFEIFRAGSVADAPADIVLDGAHNPAAAATLAAAWHSAYPDQSPALVFSAAEDKDAAGVLAILAPLAATIHLCRLDSPRAQTTGRLAAALPPGAPPHAEHPNCRAALAAAVGDGRPVLVAGSLFLVGEARALLTGRAFHRSAQ
jgi:dihydrofolate synthase/folylpolyglutamate synthase